MSTKDTSFIGIASDEELQVLFYDRRADPKKRVKAHEVLGMSIPPDTYFEKRDYEKLIQQHAAFFVAVRDTFSFSNLGKFDCEYLIGLSSFHLGKNFPYEKVHHSLLADLVIQDRSASPLYKELLSKEKYATTMDLALKRDFNSGSNRPLVNQILKDPSLVTDTWPTYKLSSWAYTEILVRRPETSAKLFKNKPDILEAQDILKLLVAGRGEKADIALKDIGPRQMMWLLDNSPNRASIVNYFGARQLRKTIYHFLLSEYPELNTRYQKSNPQISMNLSD